MNYNAVTLIMASLEVSHAYYAISYLNSITHRSQE